MKYVLGTIDHIFLKGKEGVLEAGLSLPQSETSLIYLEALILIYSTDSKVIFQ